MSSMAVLIGVPRPAPTDVPPRTVHWPELHGVHNDLAAVQAMLLQAEHPLPLSSIVQLIEPADTTAANINERLDHFVGQLEPGDTFILMLDGHGFHVPDKDGDEGDGWDEVFIASDGIPILDDEFAARWSTVDRRVTVIGLVDSCFADTNGDNIVHPATTLPEPALPVTIRIRNSAPRLFLSASLQEQTAYETDVTGEHRGVLCAALTDVWALTDGARASYSSLFGYARELAGIYDGRQTTRARFTGPSYPPVANHSPFSLAPVAQALDGVGGEV